jgi:hypothetical protein
MKNITTSASLLAILACVTLYAAPASADMVTKSVTTNADGSITHSKTLVTNRAVVAPAPAVSTTTTRTTKTEHWAPPTAEAPVTTSTTTTTTTTNRPWYAPTPNASYVYGNEDGYVLLNDRRVGGTYAGAVDRQGNNSLRYENKTFDGYNN